MRDRRDQSVLASPILIGAITTLVTVVAVFLSYNANEGLPYVPTYDISARVPSAAGLVEGNEVRIGGKRVGVVDKIDAVSTKTHPVANLHLKLDKTLEPLDAKARVTVRPRSPLGLKYLEIEPLGSGAPLGPGDTLPISQANPTVDLDQVVTSLDQKTRRSLQLATSGLGVGFAGRGVDLNATIEAAPPLLRRAGAVAANVGDPATRLREFVRGADSVAGALAPVAPRLGSFVRGANVTAGALASVTPQLRDVLSGLPPTELETTRALVTARPVLADARALVHDIRPGTRVLASAATRLHAAVVTGIPVVRRALKLSNRLNDSLVALDALASDPATHEALDRLLATVESALPTLRFVVPAQTVCNSLGVWTRNVDSTISEGDPSGTWFRTLVIFSPEENLASAQPTARLHNNTYGHTAAPGQPRECETGKEPYKPGQHFGNAPGNQGVGTEITRRPAEVRGK
jgi:ABC-type transporter Mla subunit MlaD